MHAPFRSGPWAAGKCMLCLDQGWNQYGMLHTVCIGARAKEATMSDLS